MPPGERTRKLLEKFEKGGAREEISPSSLPRRADGAANLIRKAPIAKVPHFEPQVGRKPIVPGRLSSSALPLLESPTTPIALRRLHSSILPSKDPTTPVTPGRPHSRSLATEEEMKCVPGAFPDFAVELQPQTPEPCSSNPAVTERPSEPAKTIEASSVDLAAQSQEIAILQARLRETSLRYQEAMLDAQRTKEELEKEHAALEEERKVKEELEQKLEREHNVLGAERKAKEDLEEQLSKGDDILQAERQAKHELAEELLKKHNVLEAERRAKEEVQQELFLSMAKETELHVESKELKSRTGGEEQWPQNEDDIWREIEESVWDETQAIYRTMQGDWDTVRGTLAMIIGEVRVVGPFSLLPGLN